MFNQLNRYGKNSAWAVAVLAMLLMGTACSDDKSGSDAASPSVTASASPSPSPDASQPASPEGSASAPASPTDAPSGEQTEKESSGTYNGQIDNHSIEIESADGIRAYQIDDEISDKLSAWDEGIKVKFKYKVNEVKGDGETIEQYIITSIDQQ